MEPTDAQTIKALYARATALMGEGRDEDALSVFGDIVARDANIPEVHFQIARIFLRNQKLSRALTHIRAAARLKPGVRDIWTVYAEVVRTLSDRDEQKAFRDALAAAPLDKRDKGALSVAVWFGGQGWVGGGRLVGDLRGLPQPSRLRAPDAHRHSPLGRSFGGCVAQRGPGCRSTRCTS